MIRKSAIILGAAVIAAGLSFAPSAQAANTGDLLVGAERHGHSHLSPSFRLRQFGANGLRFGYDGAGYYIEPGVRFAIGRQLEVNIAADILGVDGDTYYGAKGALFWGFTNTFGFTLDLGFLSDHSSYIGAGVRVNW